MERKLHNGTGAIVGYHTQECRPIKLNQPILCTESDAWLGHAYYFWTEEKFAHYWGLDKKKAKTGYYEIYKCLIIEEDLLNTVFNQSHYELFVKKIDQAIKKYAMAGTERKDFHTKVTRFLAENIWPATGVKGIVFQDIPLNKEDYSRVHSIIAPLYYVKRIQISIFDISILYNFELFKDKQN